MRAYRAQSKADAIWDASYHGSDDIFGRLYATLHWRTRELKKRMTGAPDDD